MLQRQLLILAATLLFAPLLCAQTTASRAGDFSAAQVPLFFPGMRLQNTPEAQYTPPPGTTRLELRSAAGHRIEALFCPALAANPDDAPPADPPTILYFYGNAQSLASALNQVDLLRRCGANVFIADYIGYGMSAGQPSEANCYATADALYQHALTRTDINPRKLIAAGWSMGAAVAIDLAHRKEVAGLITLSAYTSKRELAQRQFPGVTPDAIEHPFLSLDKIRTINAPTLIIHGRRDTLVPFEMSQRLKEASPATHLDYLPLDEAGHNDLFLNATPQIQAALQTFLVAFR